MMMRLLIQNGSYASTYRCEYMWGSGTYFFINASTIVIGFRGVLEC